MGHKNRKPASMGEIEHVVGRYHQLDNRLITKFTQFPLSSKTFEGLKKAGFVTVTEIQRDSIGLALQGYDILGAAKTGCGKTLAFLIPVLECLWRNRWSKTDGLGALIISPTRELAYQIFEVLKIIGYSHDFSAALLIGGTDLNFERKRVHFTNIVICTPGRILQHMDENYSFVCDNLQILVIDEADRILDMGFQKQVNAIMEHLPQHKQTLLFSATQTKMVSDLARLKLTNALYISVHEHAQNRTPDQLIQTYSICPDHKKINVVWSFLMNHKQKKTLIFISTCKQVRFLMEAFRRLKVDLPIMGLYSTLSHTKRMAVYEGFMRKCRGALLATDIAARGLDFPSVDWVVHMDCPCDENEYIHRSGRTARLKSSGHSLLLLTPTQQKPMTRLLLASHLPLRHISVDPEKVIDIRHKLEYLLVKWSALKQLAQKSFVAYLRSIFLMKRKDIFDVSTIDFEALAKSYGLAIAPRVRFLRKKMEMDAYKSMNNEGRMRELVVGGGEDVEDAQSSDEELLIVSRRHLNHHPDTIDDEDDVLGNNSKRKGLETRVALAKKIIRQKRQISKHICFGNESNETESTRNQRSTAKHSFIFKDAEEYMKIANQVDRKRHNERRKAIKKEKKLKKLREGMGKKTDVDMSKYLKETANNTLLMAHQEQLALSILSAK